MIATIYRKRDLIRLLVLAWLTPGCAADAAESDYVPSQRSDAAPVAWTIVVDDGLTPAEYDAVSTAALAWQTAVSGDCPIDLAFRRGPVRRTPTEILVRMSDAPGKSTTALGATLNQVIELRRAESLGTTARHELGHAFGLKHSDGIMDASSPDAITEQNVRAFCASR